MLLKDSIKESIAKVDCFLDKFDMIGTLICENDTVYLQIKNDSIQLDDNYKIEIILPNNQYYPVTYEQILTTKNADFPDTTLYAGMDCRVRRANDWLNL